MYLLKFSRAKDQRWTKDEPRINQGTPKLKMCFLLRLPSLIPCLIPPTDDREKSDRTPSQLPTTKKCNFIRLLPNKVVLIPKKVDSHPKKVDSFPETIDLPVFLRKNYLKSDFSCISRKKSVSLRPNMHLYQINA